jgi:hypothetical protein
MVVHSLLDDPADVVMQGESHTVRSDYHMGALEPEHTSRLEEIRMMGR